MNKKLILGALLFAVVGTFGCACYNPCNTGGYCGSVIAPYSCGPSSCGGRGIDYVDGGPNAGYADCGGGGCGVRFPSYGYGCGRHVVNGIRVIGEGAVGLVAAPFVLVGSLIKDGCYASYPNCGCSNEIYYGDNCYQPHDFCDPCGNGCNPCGGSAGMETVGHPYPPTPPGCSRCAGGYTEGLQPGEIEGDAPIAQKPSTSANRQPVRYTQRNSGPYAQRPTVQNQQQYTQRPVTPPQPIAKAGYVDEQTR